MKGQVSTYMQLGKNEYKQLDVGGSKPFSYYSRYTTKDPMKLSDIDGSGPAQIPGYTGVKTYKHLARNSSMPNFGPTKAEIDSQWK